MEGKEKKGRKVKNARKEWHKEIRKAKSDMWRQWVEEGKDIWSIAKIASNPFGLKESGANIQQEEGETMEEDEELKEAFVRHNLKTGELDKKKE